MRISASLAALALVVLGAGCAGGVTGGGLPHAGAAAPAGVKASLVIRIPKRPKRHGHYISPSTQSLAFDVSPAAGCGQCSSAIAVYANLTPGSAGCSNGGGETTCTLSLVLNPGTYTGAVSTNDGPLVGGVPSGTVLSENQSFPISVVAGKANLPVITLYGVPSNLVFYNLSTATLGIEPYSGPEQQFLVAGPSSQVKFQAYATDPDGGIILGPGAPTFSAVATGGFTASTKANIVTLVAPSLPNTAVSSLTITASSSGCSFALSCTFGERLMSDSLIAIADQVNNDVVIQTTGINDISPVFATITLDINTPQDVKFDSQGNLFVANSGSGTVTEYAPPYTGDPATIITGLGAPRQIALSNNGKYIAVVNGAPSSAWTYPLPYSGQSPTVITSGALSAAFDSGGNLWVGTNSSGVVEYTGGSATGLSATTGVSTPVSIAFDGSNALYVANGGAGTVTEYSSSSFYSSVAFSASVTGAGSVQRAGSNMVACGSSTGGVFDTSLNSIQSLSSGSTPCHAAYDNQANIWVTNPDVGIILRYPFPYTSSHPVSAGLSAPSAIAAFPSGT